MAQVIQKVQRPTLVLAHNKTLAAQLYAELKQLFPTMLSNILAITINITEAYAVDRYLHSEGRHHK